MYDWLIFMVCGAVLGFAAGWAIGWRLGIESFKLKMWNDYDRVGRMYLYDTRGNIKILKEHGEDGSKADSG